MAVVLPSRRAGLHLRKYLAQRHGRALWSPDALDPGAFLARIAGWRQGTSTELLLMLHQCHRAVLGAQAEPLHEFLQWGPTTMRDLSEVDAHLLDLDQVYKDLRAYHEIETWSLKGSESLTASQQRTVANWEVTGRLHRMFTERMHERGVGTSGAIARRAASITGAGAWTAPWSSVWIAGLNALDPATTAVLKHLQRMGVLHLAWDGDRHYVESPDHEAGRFLRRSMEALGAGTLALGNLISERQRRISLRTSPDRMAMVADAADWVHRLPQADRADTVIVLADEGLMLPLLEAMPADTGPVNISMGVPLDSLPIHGLVEKYLGLFDGSGRIPTAGLIDLVTHPLLHQGPPTLSLTAALRATQQVSLSTDRISTALEQAGVAPAAAVALCGGPLPPAAAIQALIGWGRQARPDDSLAQEQLFLVARLERELAMALANAEGRPERIPDFLAVRKRLLGHAELALFGEPLEGLQIMGLLETRAIDFKRVLIVGATEGTLIGRDEPMSWIPFDLRRHYRLPLRADAEAIGSYHVHRLLHQAAEVVLLHATGSDGSAPARFPELWEHELAPRSATILQRTELAAASHPRPKARPHAVKAPWVLERLRALTAKGLSPSALGVWLRCPMDFHTRYVLGVKELGSPAPELGSDALGTAVHKALEGLYRDWLGTRLDSDRLREAAGSAETLLFRELSGRFERTLLESGSFLLQRSMAADALSRHLAAEANRVAESATIPLAVEQPMAAELPGGLRIRGTCDRLELRDGMLHILDLKTGSVRAEQLRMKDLSREAMHPRSQFALQLLMYAMMALEADPALPAVRAGIIPVRTPSQSDGIWLSIGREQDIRREQLPAMRDLITVLMQELLDPQRPFAHNPDSRHCLCCLQG